VDRARRRKYPWKEWFAGDRFVLVRGIDFDTRTDLMIQQIRTHAGPDYYDCTVRITVADDGSALAVDIFPKGPQKGKGRPRNPKRRCVA